MRKLARIAGVASLAVLSGCTAGADLFNSDFLSGLGLDVGALGGGGRTIITFTNETDGVADFLVAVSDDVNDPTSNARPVFSTGVEPGESRHLTVDCPFGVITPGDPSEDFTTGTTSVAVLDATGFVEVAYFGTPLVYGSDFACGDVIELAVVEASGATDDAAATYAIEIRVIPGR